MMTPKGPVVDDLTALGLSKLGSHVYVSLLQHGHGATGYEVSKDLGVARANVYDALRMLVRSGFAEARQGSMGIQYTATPFSLIAEHQLHDLKARIERLQEALPQGLSRLQFWQGVGWPAFRQQVDAALHGAKSSVRVGTSVLPIREIKDVLDHRKDVPVTYGCWQGCPAAGCGVCQAPVDPLNPWINDPACLVLVDNRMAVGSWGSSHDPVVLATDYPAIVAGWRTLVETPGFALGSGKESSPG